jgi:hypothetical protein
MCHRKLLVATTIGPLMTSLIGVAYDSHATAFSQEHKNEREIWKAEIS